MRSRATPLRFWGSALLAALGFAAAVALLFPYATLGMESEPERERAWLVTVWTAGVMAILFGLAGTFGAFRMIGIREVKEAGSISAAQERQRQTLSSGAPRRAWFPVAAGGWLVVIYFVGWFILK